MEEKLHRVISAQISNPSNIALLCRVMRLLDNGCKLGTTMATNVKLRKFQGFVALLGSLHLLGFSLIRAEIH